MHRKRRMLRPTNWIGPIVIAVVMGGVAYTVSDLGSRNSQLVASEDREVATTTVELIEKTVTTTPAVVVPSGLRIVSSEDRGFRLTDGGDWNVALRAQSGEAYTEPRLLGAFDDRHVAVMARLNRLRILNVSRSGQVIAIYDVPENAMVFDAVEGAVWMTTFTPGEGIESDPIGPSTLYRITSDGKRTAVATDETRVFAGVSFEQGEPVYRFVVP